MLGNMKKIVFALALVSLAVLPAYALTPFDGWAETEVEELKSSISEAMASGKIDAGLRARDERAIVDAYAAYCQGWGVEKDVKKGISYLETNKDLCEPKFRLAEQYCRGYYDQPKQVVEAITLFKECLAETDDESLKAWCCFRLGFLCEFEPAAGGAFETALKWYRQAVEHGDIGERKAQAGVDRFEGARGGVRSVGDMVKEYESNIFTFMQNYDDRYVSVQGRVTRIGRERYDSGDVGYYFELGSGEIFDYQPIRCYFRDDNDLAKIKTGDLVTVRGLIYTYEDFWGMDYCQLIPGASTPPPKKKNK